MSRFRDPLHRRSSTACNTRCRSTCTLRVWSGACISRYFESSPVDLDSSWCSSSRPCRLRYSFHSSRRSGIYGICRSAVLLSKSNYSRWDPNLQHQRQLLALDKRTVCIGACGWLRDTVVERRSLNFRCRSSAGQGKFAGQSTTFYKVNCATQPTKYGSIRISDVSFHRTVSRLVVWVNRPVNLCG